MSTEIFRTENNGRATVKITLIREYTYGSQYHHERSLEDVLALAKTGWTAKSVEVEVIDHVEETYVTTKTTRKVTP